jgi:hypothetical protein
MSAYGRPPHASRVLRILRTPLGPPASTNPRRGSETPGSFEDPAPPRKRDPVAGTPRGNPGDPRLTDEDRTRRGDGPWVFPRRHALDPPRDDAPTARQCRASRRGATTRTTIAPVGRAAATSAAIASRTPPPQVVLLSAMGWLLVLGEGLRRRRSAQGFPTTPTRLHAPFHHVPRRSRSR